MAKVCSQCGRRIETLVRFCPGCGSELPPEPVQELVDDAVAPPTPPPSAFTPPGNEAVGIEPLRGQTTQRFDVSPPGKRISILKLLMGAVVLVGVIAACGFILVYMQSKAAMDKQFAPLDAMTLGRGGGYLSAEVEEKYNEALEFIKERIGLELPHDRKIPIYVIECHGISGLPPGALAFADQYHKTFHRKTFVVFCSDFFSYLNDFLTNEISIEFVLNHEMVHAVMLEIMGVEDFMELPIWFIEGSAEYGSGQARDRIHLMKYYGQQKPAFMNPIKDDMEGHTGDDYAVDYLHFLFIRDMDGNIVAGERRVRNFIHDVVVERMPFEKAVKLHTGLEMDDFREQAMQYAHRIYKTY